MEEVKEPESASEDVPDAAEPVITGTLFLNTIILIMIFGFWVMMYFTLLGR